jgi:hypothetical protein
MTQPVAAVKWCAERCPLRAVFSFPVELGIVRGACGAHGSWLAVFRNSVCIDRIAVISSSHMLTVQHILWEINY